MAIMEFTVLKCKNCTQGTHRVQIREYCFGNRIVFRECFAMRPYELILPQVLPPFAVSQHKGLWQPGCSLVERRSKCFRYKDRTCEALNVSALVVGKHFLFLGSKFRFRKTAAICVEMDVNGVMWFEETSRTSKLLPQQRLIVWPRLNVYTKIADAWTLPALNDVLFEIQAPFCVESLRLSASSGSRRFSGGFNKIFLRTFRDVRT